jgi:NAD(P)-dependent dehydrogenase (short-subunit alcohol dehydrogenase family)
MDLELKGKTAIVTGGNRGIGKAIALELAREGVNVAIVARDKAALEKTAGEIARVSNSVKVLQFSADTGDDAAVKKMVADALAGLGRIDILVNCAAQVGGQGKPPALAEITNDHFWGDMNIKVMGYLRTAREVAPHMIKQGSGRIINVSGLAARQTGTIIGSMRNIAVAALTKNLADELAPHGVSAVCVHPGLTRTEKTPGVVAAQAKAQGVSEAEIEKRMAGRNLAKKLITAEDIAHVVTFLASPKSVAISGDSIAAGGGAPGVDSLLIGAARPTGWMRPPRTSEGAVFFGAEVGRGAAAVGLVTAEGGVGDRRYDKSRQSDDVWSRKPCNLSTTRSAHGCHPCLRYSLLPMSPGRTNRLLVPAEGFEPPTNGLQNRCSTTELSRPQVCAPARTGLSAQAGA